MSGRYASYWNAFLFSYRIEDIRHKKCDVPCEDNHPLCEQALLSRSQNLRVRVISYSLLVEKEEESPEWAAKLAERSGEDIVNKVQQQKGIYLRNLMLIFNI